MEDKSELNEKVKMIQWYCIIESLDSTRAIVQATQLGIH